MDKTTRQLADDLSAANAAESAAKSNEAADRTQSKASELARDKAKTDTDKAVKDLSGSIADDVAALVEPYIVTMGRPAAAAAVRVAAAKVESQG